MKVSLSKFYQEVTGQSTTVRSIIAPALKRWQVPFDKSAKARTDAVDVKWMPLAQEGYQKELAANAGNGARRTRGKSVSKADFEALVKLVGDLEANMHAMQKQLADHRAELLVVYKDLSALREPTPPNRAARRAAR